MARGAHAAHGLIWEEIMRLTRLVALGLVGFATSLIVARHAHADCPLTIDLGKIVNEDFIVKGQVELSPKHRGWYEANSSAAEFKMGNSWYELYKPRCSTSGDGKTLVSFQVHHINNSRRTPPDVVNVELTLDSKTAKLIASEVKTKIADKLFTTGSMPAPDPKASAVIAGLDGLEGFLKNIGARGGKLQLPTVVKHCTNAVLLHTKPK
jgi:hypothetical protein